MFRAKFILLALLSMVSAVHAEDIDGVAEHGLISRYPGQDIRWQTINNYLPFRVPIGEVTGYRTIGDWIDTQGRITRTFYHYNGSERSFAEFYLNYLEALKAQGFDILGKGVSGDRKGVAVGSRRWSEVYFIANPTNSDGEVGTFFAGTSSSGGAGAIVARKKRAGGMVYVVIGVEQHAADYVGTLIDIIEVESAETGLVIVDVQAMGEDMKEYGRVVLDGIVFDYDEASLKPESDPALEVIAGFLKNNPEKMFYVVGHTDSVGTFAYNATLSSDRAAAVVAELEGRFDIASDRLEPHGIGQLSPAFSNGQDAGKEKNRRVELVER